MSEEDGIERDLRTQRVAAKIAGLRGVVFEKMIEVNAEWLLEAADMLERLLVENESRK